MKYWYDVLSLPTYLLSGILIGQFAGSQHYWEAGVLAFLALMFLMGRLVAERSFVLVNFPKPNATGARSEDLWEVGYAEGWNSCLRKSLELNSNTEH